MATLTSPPGSFDSPGPGGWVETEISMQHIARMITDQRAPDEILAAVCDYLGPEDAGRQAAFFRLDGDCWRVAASGGIAPPAAASLAAIDPARLFAQLLDGASAGREESCPFGWARFLFSGAGEFLAIMVGLADGPMLPCGLHAVRVESACRLAVLALEQNNLIAELPFHPAAEQDLAALLERARDAERLMQHVNQMIAQQRPPSEILEFLCRNIGPGRAERQVAFFRTDGEKWTLAATGDLDASAQAALDVLNPGRLSDALFLPDADNRRAESPFKDGWARHLYSGAGELLGIVVGFADGPVLPIGLYATRLESVCRLAALAIEQNNLIAELAFKADYDPLTALPNRSCYERLLGATLHQNKRAGDSTALLYINLDRFRMINDVMGTAIGNQLLKRVGRRFQECVRQKDVVARAGGDEFAVLLNDYNRSDADAVAQRLLRSLAHPFSIEGHEIYVSASIGIGCAAPESAPESLEREARVALYQAKQAGKGRSMHFHPSMAATRPERLEMEKRLRQALSRQELRLHYQPQIDLASGAVRGAEALLRWKPDGLGNVSPAAFVPILEETGLIVEVGRWVLAEACRQGKAWTDRAGRGLRIGVNVSAVQFAEGFEAEVSAALAETGFPADQLELELTESLFVGDFAAASLMFERLRKTGIQLALDDFGTGQSSLSYLNRLPFERLKIDQSFVRPIGRAKDCPPLLRSIVQMAHSLGMSTIAEGVETSEQEQLLRSLGCIEAQGFLYSPGLPPDEFVRLLA